MNEPSFNPPGLPATETPPYFLGAPQESATTVSSVGKSGKAGRLAVAGLVGVLGVGGAFAARAALQAPEGPASSDEAVALFFEALDNEDFIGVAEVMHPAERESLAQPLIDMANHARRLELIGAEADPAAAAFLDIQVEGMTYSVEQTDPGLHYVTTTGGSISMPETPSVPQGALFERFDIETEVASSSDRATADLAADPMKMAIVEEDGSWYVSLYYSAAEAARRSAGEGFPGLGNGPTPVGSASPDEVMEDMTKAVFDLDAAAFLTLLDPEEAGVFYDYAPLYLDEIQDGLDDVDAYAELAEVEWNVEFVDFVASDVNGRKVVNFNEIKITAEVGVGDLSDEAMSGFLTIAGDCTTIMWAGESTKSCADDQSPEAEAARELIENMIETLDLSETTINAYEKLSAVEGGITVVERDGRWFLSIVPTVLESANDLMAVLEPGDLVAVGTDIEEIVEDQDRIIEELTEVFVNSDLDALVGAEGLDALGELQGLLGTSGFDSTSSGSFEGSGGTFVPVSPSLDSEMTDEEWEAFLEEFDSGNEEYGSGGFSSDDGYSAQDYGATETSADLAPLMAPSLEDHFSTTLGESFLMIWADSAALPPFVAGSYGYTTDRSIEVLLFESPVDGVAALSGSGFDFEIVEDVVYATDGYGTTIAFVGNYAVWSDVSQGDGSLFQEQVAILKGS